MKILILGGTVFLGRQIVEAARKRGHEVTLFNRGQHNPDLFPDVEKLRGDRDGDMGALEGRRWDSVIDPSGYFPRVVRASAELLAHAVDHYTFISTLSVYSDLDSDHIDESAPVGTIEDETVEEITGETYGPLKALCERAVEETVPGRALIVRPGLIVGPNDPTDRFTYWPARVARGEDVLAPDRPDRVIQFIDVRDLAEWTVRMVEERATGVYNATGLVPNVTMGDLLESARSASDSDAEFIWMDEQFLLGQGVQPWMELPLWVPDTPEYRGFNAFDNHKAIAAGLTYRPLEVTVRDTIAWEQTRPADHEWRAGMTPDRESELLNIWKNSATE